MINVILGFLTISGDNLQSKMYWISMFAFTLESTFLNTLIKIVKVNPYFFNIPYQNQFQE